MNAAYQKVQSRLDNLAPRGYSCAGIVIAAGQGVAEFQPGDRVTCAGVGYASHCEVNFIPKIWQWGSGCSVERLLKLYRTIS